VQRHELLTYAKEESHFLTSWVGIRLYISSLDENKSGKNIMAAKKKAKKTKKKKS
jgi:hypothetical protein